MFKFCTSTLFIITIHFADGTPLIEEINEVVSPNWQKISLEVQERFKKNEQNNEHPSDFFTVIDDTQENVESLPKRAVYEKTFQVVLDPKQKTKLFAEVMTPVKKINKKMGEHFKKDEVLILLDNAVLNANFNKSMAQWNKAKAELESIKELFEEGLASYFELKQAEAELASAEAESIFAINKLKNSIITAPYNGVVDSVIISEHELPQQNKELMTIVDDSQLIAKFLLSSQLLKHIHLGQKMMIYVSETDEVIPARISRIGGMIDPASSTIKIESEIENPHNRIKPGMTGVVTLRLGEE